jgi:hypothetical protein
MSRILSGLLRRRAAHRARSGRLLTAGYLLLSERRLEIEQQRVMADIQLRAAEIDRKYPYQWTAEAADTQPVLN